MFCSWSVSLISEESGSLIFVAARRRDCGKLRPASSVTTSRSIRSGRERSIWSRRCRARRADDRRRQNPAEDDGADASEHDKPCFHATDRPERQPQEGAADGHEELSPEQSVGGRRVHPGCDQTRSVVATPELGEP